MNSARPHPFKPPACVGRHVLNFLISLTRIGIPISNLQPEDAQAEIDFARNG
jgi:hypothetical protein